MTQAPGICRAQEKGARRAEGGGGLPTGSATPSPHAQPLDQLAKKVGKKSIEASGLTVVQFHRGRVPEGRWIKDLP
jgi:hypothetical protein